MLRRRLTALYAVAAFVVLLDRLTKSWAVAELAAPRVIEPNWLRLELVYNPGAAFSFLTGATWVFTLVASVVVVAIVRFAPRLRHTGWAAAVGGVLGGAAGNLIDRLVNAPGFARGHVIDFLQVPAVPLFQTFNLADAALTVSVAALVLMSWRGRQLDGSLPLTTEGQQ